MKKQRICFIFLFLICLLMPSVAMADLDVRIFALPGDGRSYAISTIKSVTFTTEVTGEDWSPISGKTVTFSVSPDDGIVSLSTTSATTDSNGQAQTTVSLSGDSSETSYRFRATLDTGEWYWAPIFVWDGAELTLGVDGPGSSYEAGESVRFTFRHRKHRVEDPAGRTVTFSVSPDDGTVSLSPTSATTDSNGEASTTLTTGSGSSGSYTVTASGGGHSISYTVTVETSSSPPPTDPNPDPPEVNSRSGVRQIPQEQRAAPEDSIAQPQQTAPESSTGNTPTQQAAPQTSTPESSTGNTPAQQAAPQTSTPESSTGNTPTQQAAPQTSTGNTQGTPRSVLVLSIPVISKTVLDSGESFTLSVTVENTSEGLSPETILRYYRGSDIGVSGTEVGKKTVSPIAAMGTSDVSISLTAPDALGTYLYYACISSVPGESNTGNTCTPNSVQLTVRGEPQDTSEPQGTSKYDINGDGAVDIEDAALVVGAFGTNTAKYDVDGNGHVDIADLLLIITNRQEAASAPSVVGMKFTAAQMERIQVQVALLAATNNRSPAAMQTLAYLRSLIAVAHPEKTQLLANYPNPFNPETWIPYRLAKVSEVVVEIFASNGRVVRRLQLGHQPAGIYQSRSRAAYWDGKNEYGEPVASGVYFYTLTAGDFTATRKMLIRK